MMIFLMIIHALVCVLLACIILMQAGRGGGLTENFASAESIFGAQTNVLLVKTTTILATIFIVTSLGLTIMHSMKGKSLLSDRVTMPTPISTQKTDQMQKDLKTSAQNMEEKVDQAIQKTESSMKQMTQEAAKEINKAEQNIKVAVPEIKDTVTPSALPGSAQ